MPSVDRETFLTRAQVAERLAVSVSTVGNLILSGELYAARVGKQYRIPTDAVDAYLSGEKYGESDPLARSDWSLEAPTPSLFDPQQHDDAVALHYAREVARVRGWNAGR